jgi:hypothetical protein
MKSLLKPRALLKPLALVLPLALAACTGGTATAPTPTPTPSSAASAAPSAAPTPHNTNQAEQEACEHLPGGPAVAVTGTLEAAVAPEVKADHQRYDVTFVAGPGGNTGTVRFNSPEAVEWSFIMNQNVPIQVRDAAGVALPIVETKTSSTFCGDIKAAHILLLGVGPVTVQFGPTTEKSVGLVIEESHPHEEGDDHED